MTYHLKIHEYPARNLILVPCVLACSRLYVYWGLVGGLRKVVIDLQLRHIWLHRVAWLQWPFTQRNPPFKPNYTCRNNENAVGLRQVDIKSLFRRHLCLFEVVSLDLLPFAFTIESRQEYRNSSDKVKRGKESYFCSVLFLSTHKLVLICRVKPYFSYYFIVSRYWCDGAIWW